MSLATISPPSSGLPALSRLSDTCSDQISRSLDNLRAIYWPPAPPPLPPKLALPIRKHLQLIHDDSVPDSGYASADEEEGSEEDYTAPDQDPDESLDLLRGDPLERAFAIKWITAFIARSDSWVESALLDDEVESARRAEVVEQATAILSAFVGGEQEEECSVTRSFHFPFYEGGVLEAELNDAPLSREDHTSVGLQSWASSILLAERMAADPKAFSLAPRCDTQSQLRVLELGAGTGLLSIVAAKILQRSSLTDSIVVATDYHPDVLANLEANVSTNFPRSSPVSVNSLDWEFPDYSRPLNEYFDVILAADVIYHPEHARWIKTCVQQLLLPCTGQDPGGVFWLIIPLRVTGRHEGMYHTVEEVFSERSTECVLREDAYGQAWKLAIVDRDEFGRKEGVGRADEGGYMTFKIGWIRA